ncbi:DUF6758 family protein [Actinomadura gamaensis]|uniref:DUF6758 family protein n=1 Tax=Actinomadura gamaensis TaxID=1763541 RepID=A0ABV9TQA6_9ACTN
MRAETACPRCAGRLRAPNAWSSDWWCQAHGAVLPRQPARRPSAEGLTAVVQDARVPVWLPWPLPKGWLVTGFATVGDDRTGARAVAVALAGPGILSGPAEVLLIAEEPGIGLGAYFGGLPGPDPGLGFDAGPPHVKLELCRASASHGVAMWAVSSGRDDRAVYVGEAKGLWLWAVLCPAEAGALMLERPPLLDLRDPGLELSVPFGAPSPLLDV